MAGDPHHGAAVVELRDGGRVRIRPLEPADAPALVRFHDRLSAETRRRRFFSAHPHLSAAEVQRFTELAHPDRVAYIAEDSGELIAVGRYERDGDEAEVAFVVDDDHQGRGIGTVLLGALAACAVHHGVRTFRADVLADNGPMLRVFRDAGYESRWQLEGGVVRLAFDLGHAGS